MFLFILGLIRCYVIIGMFVVMAVWVWNKVDTLKRVQREGISEGGLEPFGLDRYLWIWFWWPGFVHKVLKKL